MKGNNILQKKIMCLVLQDSGKMFDGMCRIIPEESGRGKSAGEIQANIPKKFV